MSGPSEALVTAAFSVGMSAAVGYGLNRVISPSRVADTPLLLARSWLSWAAALISLVALPPFFRLLDATSFLRWVIAFVICGGLAFTLGWSYGRLIRFRWQYSGPSSQRTGFDEELYAVVGAEVQGGEMRPGLWTRALEETGYDEQKAKAAYIELRVASLRTERTAAARGKQAEQGVAKTHAAEELAAARIPKKVLSREEWKRFYKRAWLLWAGCAAFLGVVTPAAVSLAPKLDNAAFHLFVMILTMAAVAMPFWLLWLVGEWIENRIKAR